jgi:hypothetical protein
MMTAGEYLTTVKGMHGLSFRGMARALRVHPAVLGRWRRGVGAPSWRRLQAMTALWGGNPHIILLGTVLERYCRETGLTREEARRLCLTGRAAAMPRRRRSSPPVDRDQLRLPIEPGRGGL